MREGDAPSCPAPQPSRMRPTSGAGGQVLRGVGELRGSSTLKAYGYFAGALAYVVTASISLSAAAYLLPPLR